MFNNAYNDDVFFLFHMNIVASSLFPSSAIPLVSDDIMVRYIIGSGNMYNEFMI